MRVIEKKRPPLMNPKRWLIVTPIVIAALTISCVWYYRTIQQPFWQEKEAAYSKVKEQSDMTSIQSIHKYVWDETSWIASGTTEADEPITVVIRKEADPIVVSTSSLISYDDMLKTVTGNSNEALVKRLQLGFMEGQLVWEAYIKRADRFYYAFYRGVDGQFIDEYQLLNKTER